MYNYSFIVGRVVRDVEVRKTDSGKAVATITLAVTKPFKNPQTNAFDTDFINAVLWEPICNTVAEYTHKGDVVGLKGRLQTKKEEIEGQNYYLTEFVGEKVIFLSANSKTED